ncbi:hypothetical protein JW835_00565 [bacterium]|nr:hypothetical protein [bacterium]
MKQRLKIMHKLFFIYFLIILTGFGIIAQDIIPEDRRIDWNPGIPGGIPGYPVGVNAVDFGAVGNGIIDDTQAIQNAINACGAMAVTARASDPDAGYAIYLPAGTYLTTNRLNLNHSGIVLRGDGPNQTRIQFNSENTSTAIIGIFSTGGSYTQYIKNIIDGAVKGSTSVVLDEATGVTEGSIWLFDQLNDGEIVTHIGGGGAATWCSRENGTRAMGQIVQITAVNGNTVSFEPPLYLDFNASLSPQAMNFIRRPIFNSGIEDLCIEQIGSNARNNLTLETGAFNWIRNIESINSNEDHVSCLYNYRSTIRDSYFHHASSHMGGHGYGVKLGLTSTACLVENNIFYYLRHPLMTCWGAAGNVVAYNYSAYVFMRYEDYEWACSDLIGSHGAYPVMNLFESNWGQMIDNDYYWGTSGYQVYFRNRSAGYQHNKENRFLAVTFEKGNLYGSVIGNVLGVPVDNYPSLPYYEIEGIETTSQTPAIYRLGYLSVSDGDPDDNDPQVKATLLRHGNYDFVTKQVFWDPEIPNHNLPTSLYLQSKPGFFGEQSWPCIGPDVSPMINKLPAQLRFEQNYPDSPRKPSNLVAEAVSSTEVTLTWQDHAISEIGFIIERSPDGVTFQEITTFAGLNDNYLIHHYVDSGLSASTAYCYRICAYNDHGHSDYTNIASAITDDGSSVGPVLFCRFEDSIADSSDHAYPAQASGDPDFTNGVSGRAINLDGDGDCVAFNWDNPIEGSDQSFTLAAWVNPRNITGNRWVFGEHYGYRNFIFGLNQGQITIKWRYTDHSGEIGTYMLKSYENLIPGQYHHIAAVYNAQSKTVSMFLNGSRIRYDIASQPFGIRSVNTLYIGRGTEINTVEYFDGRIDETKIYDVALSPSEVEMLAILQVNLQIKIFLEGPYGTGSMETGLQTGDHLPLRSPYDDEEVISFPDNIVDWMQVELRTSADGSGDIYTKSAFLKNDGCVVDTDGSDTVTVEAPEGNYYIVVRHRNHLAIMSNQPFHLSSSL